MKFDDSIPLYLQIESEIENAILKKQLPEDKAIPSIRKLAKQYKLNPQTISNAINELVNAGIIYKKRGIGMFVQKGARKILREKKMRTFKELDIKCIIQKSRSLGFSKAQLIKLIEENFYEKGGN